MILFHVTKKRNLQKISRDGLIPSKGARSRKLSEPRPAIYLLRSMADVEDAIMNWLGDEFDEDEELVALKVLVPKGFEVARVAFEYQVFRKIPPSAILEIIPI